MARESDSVLDCELDSVLDCELGRVSAPESASTWDLALATSSVAASALMLEKVSWWCAPPRRPRNSAAP